MMQQQQQQSYPWTEIPTLGLQPLDFKKLPPPSGDSGVVVYQALVKSAAPCTPTFSLTVTAAAPGEDQQAERELQCLLRTMQALFLLTDQGPDEGLYDDPEPGPFNPDTEIEIAPALVGRNEIEETFGVVMVLETAVDGSTEAEAAPAALSAAPITRDRVPAGRDHKYTHYSSPMWAKVTPSRGSGSVRSRGNPPHPVPGSAYGRTVFVHGYSFMRYTITSGWRNRGLV
jgi:hypothetical protein